MTAIARRLAICTLALGTVALAACSGDPVSPKAHGPASYGILQGSDSRIDTVAVIDSSTTHH